MIPGRDQRAIVGKITTRMERAGLDALILTSGDAVFYATGFMVRSLYRSGKTGNAAAVVTADGSVALICSEFEKHAAIQVCDPSVKIEAYPVWIYIEDYAYDGMTKEVQPDLNRTFAMASQFVPAGGAKIGVQNKWITYDAGRYLRERFGEDHVLSCDKLLAEARTTKTPWEIDVLRHNARLAERAMNLTARTFVPGITAADVYHTFHRICLELAPDLTAVSQSHTIGTSIAPEWMPVPTRVNYGDLIRLDGGPYTNGYKSDLGRTYVVGNSTNKEREELYAALWRGYEFAVDNIGPGVRMCDIFRGVHEAIGMKEYVRGHFGHSIGCDVSGEEAPFISPEEERVFEPNMVFCFETPFYSTRRQTYNIEDTFAVTETGVEWFTRASPTMYV